MSLESITTRMRKGEAFNRKCYADGGRLSGGVYIADESHWDFISDVMRMFIVVNPLHSFEFLPVTQMEAEIIRMVANLFHGDPETSCGLGTSGGTESILLAMLAYRQQGLVDKGIK